MNQGVHGPLFVWALSRDMPLPSIELYRYWAPSFSFLEVSHEIGNASLGAPDFT